ncbi:MAG TPA: biotin transporter BioY [Terriglobales bacterium]|nr:biotin transporter BioY [Terriglobales bacterium]
MSKQVAQAAETRSWKSASLAKNIALIVGASLLMGILGRFAVPLPFTPVPLSLANFGVLLVGLTLGSRRGFAALVLYLAEGAIGMPVFAPSTLPGVAQLLGPTGGYLLAYPFVALLAGWIAERGSKSFARFAVASLAGEILLFASGVAWLMVLLRAPLAQAANFGLFPFVFAEIIKVMAAAELGRRICNSRIADLLS